MIAFFHNCDKNFYAKPWKYKVGFHLWSYFWRGRPWSRSIFAVWERRLKYQMLYTQKMWHALGIQPQRICNVSFTEMQGLVQTQIDKDLLSIFIFMWDLSRSLSAFNAHWGFCKQVESMHVVDSI